MRSIACAFAALSLSIFAALAPAAADDRFAAVVAAQSYADSIGAAAGALDDAALVAQALDDAGFVVEVFEDADQGDIRRAAARLGDNLALAGEDAVGVFYFVGNAVQVDNRSYLMGVDARAGDAFEIVETAVPADDVVGRMNRAGNAPNFVVIDVSAPSDIVQTLDLERGLATFDAPEDGMVIFSEYPGEAPPARGPGVSAFAAAFAELVGSEATVFSDAVSTFRRAVRDNSDGLRRAWTAGRPESSRFRFTDPDLIETAAGPADDAVLARSVIRLPPAQREDDAADAAEGYHMIDVFFGADRAYERRRGEIEFTNDPGDELAYGVAEVSIPPNHERGVMESPRWWRFEFVADPERHVTFQGFDLRSDDEFFTEVRGVVQQSETHQAFVFIHGFNTSFENGLRRTAQLHHDLGFDGAPIAYLWSSMGEASPLAYNRDTVAADRTAPRLERFLERVADETGAEHIHVIAHSMGGRALVQALERIGGRRDTAAFEQIVLAAPDIDREVFEELAASILPLGERVTLYASDNDQALETSRRWHGGFERAGEITDEGIVMIEGMDSIDASSSRTDVFEFGHEYISSEVAVLEDVGELMSTGLAPPERSHVGFEEHALDNGVYWEMRAEGE